MYILVEIIHTEFQYISLIEMQKYNWNRKRIEKRKTWKKKRPFVPVGNTNRDKRVRQPRGRWLHLLSRLVLPTGTKGPLLSRLPHPGQKGTPLLSRTGVPGWETGTTAVSQPGQINVFVVVEGRDAGGTWGSREPWKDSGWMASGEDWAASG